MKNFNTQAPFLQRIRSVLVIGVLLVVAACSSVRFAYNQGDTVLYWWVNAYLDLDSEQSGLVKEDIDQLFNWHRKTQLKDYSQLLAKAKTDLATGKVTLVDLKATYKDIRGRTEALALKAVPELTELALSIKPEQLVKMEEKFNKNNETYRKKFVRVDNDKKQTLRYKKSMEQFELWFGNFSSEQEAQLKRASDVRPLNNELWLEERIIRQKKIVSVLRKIQAEKLNKEATIALLHDLLKDIFGRFEAPERKAFFDAYIESSMNLVLTAVRIATPAQKAHAHKRMQDWINDFRDLSVQSN
jgi:hypothetical protein